MWHVVAEEDTKCTECSHKISAGAECLSQMPVVMPEGFRRRKYENFCIYCPECNDDKAQSACYARRLNHWNTNKAKLNQPVPCAHCGESISKGKKTVVQIIYDWPKLDDSDGDLEPRDRRTAANGKFVGPAAAVAGATRPSGVGWHSLSQATQRKFQTAGLGGARGSRTPAMAQRLYESVPKIVRNQGESAVLEFMRGKHASHIRSVANAPGRMRQPGNVVFESAKKNLSRGSRNMTAAEVNAARSAGRVSAMKTTLKGGAKAGLIAAATEAPVAALENYFHWKRGRKNGKQATKDAAKSTAVVGGIGVATWGAASGASMIGLSLRLGPLGVPVAVAGFGLLAYTGVSRIYKAAKRDLPLDELCIVLCKDGDCKTRFAQDVVDATLGIERSVNWGFVGLFVLLLSGLGILFAVATL